MTVRRTTDLRLHTRSVCSGWRIPSCSFSVSTRKRRLSYSTAWGAEFRSGEPLMPGIPVDLEEWSRPIIPDVVPNAGDIVFSANRYYQRPDLYSVPVLQLTYADLNGKFPWEVDFKDPRTQPRPGTFKA